MVAVFIPVLVILAALAHGGVETWATAGLQVAVVIVFMTAMLCGFFKIHKTPLDLLILAFITITSFSVIFSSYLYPSLLLLGRIISYIILYYLCFLLICSKKQFILLTAGMAVWGSLYAVLSLIFMEGSFLGFRIFSSVHSGIAFTFANHNHFAAFMNMIVWLCIGLGLGLKQGRGTLLLVLGIFGVLAIFASVSRGGLLGFSTSLVFFICAGFSQKIKPAYFLPLVGFIGIVTGCAVWFGLEPLLLRFANINIQSSLPRIEIWKCVFNYIASNPLCGSGLGTFSYIFPQYQSASLTGMFINHAHNDYLELIAETGVLGFLIVLTGAFYFSRILKQVIHLPDSRLRFGGLGAMAGCVGMLTHSFLEFNFYIPANALLFVVYLSITLVSVKLDQSTPTRNLKFSLRLAVSAGMLFLLFVALQINPGNASILAHKGDLLLQDRLYRQSLNYYEQALKLCPQSDFYFKKAFCLQQLGENLSAEKSLQAALNLEPANPNTQYNLANYYLFIRQTKLAYPYFKQFLKDQPQDINLVLAQLWNIQPAYDFLEPAVPSISAIRAAFSNYLFAKKLDRAAVLELGTAFAIEPSPLYACQHLHGFLRIKACQPGLKIGKKYAQRFKDDLEIQKALARLYACHGEPGPALEIYQRLILLKPEEPASFTRPADLYSQLKDYHNAVSMIKKGLTQYPDYVGFYTRLAHYYRMLQKPAKTLEVLKKLIRHHPDNPDYHYQLGGEYHKLGLFQQAVNQWQKCLQLDTQHQSCRRRCKLLLKELGM